MMCKIAIMGFGTIGSGVLETLTMNKKAITGRVGDNIEVKYILDIRDFSGTPIEHMVVNDYKKIAEDPEIKVVVETMGGVEPANTFVRAMLEKGKSVCTSNKALVAACGPQLMELAYENHCNFLFGASVAGGIPIIRPLQSCLTADVITEITGILNGTTNYILTKMHEEGCNYESALKEAQALGYAERDPSADVGGGDTGRKIAILSSIVMNKKVVFEDIHLEGITEITLEDFRYADALGRSIKLLGRSLLPDDPSDTELSAYVAPHLIRRESPLYGIEDVFNGVVVVGNTADRLMFYGRGAGKLPTASAVVADVVEAARLADQAKAPLWGEDAAIVRDYLDYAMSYLVRLSGETLSERAKKCLKAEEVITGIVPGEIAVLTAPMSGRELLAAKEELGNVIASIRIYEE